MYKPQIDPRLAFNVKYATHKVCINHLSYNDNPMQNEWIEHIDWWLTGKQGLTKGDIIVVEPSGLNPWEDPRVFSETMKERGLIDNVPCIEVQAKAPGDVDFDVEIKYNNPEWRPKDPDSEQYFYLRFEAEKKYFDIYRSELDLNPDTTEWVTERTVTVPAGSTGWRSPQKMVDTIWGLTPGYAAPQFVDGAMVHWWLLKDTPANKAKIRSLMQYIADHDESGHGFYEDFSAAGTYGPFEDFMVDPANPGEARQPWGWIMDWATTAGQYADPNLFRFHHVAFEPEEVVGSWYARSTSLKGKAEAHIQVNQSMLEPCTPESVMIVVLVTYPGVDPTWDPANGENRIAIQIAQKEYHKEKKEPPPVTTPKTPQLRWAGEPIVLEHDWGVAPYVTIEELPCHEDHPGLQGETGWLIEGKFYAAIYNNEQQSIGDLVPVVDMSGYMLEMHGVGTIHIDFASIGFPGGANQVISPLGGGMYSVDEGGLVSAVNNSESGTEWSTSSVSRAMLTSEVSGEADVNASLYEVGFRYRTGPEHGLIEAWAIGPVAKQGFLVYYLEFEDITISDVTPPSSLMDLTPDVDDAHVAVQVRGFFDYRNSHLMATTRPAKEIEIPGAEYGKILPAGRYVLPDDWVLLAETNNVKLRPNWDLMDMAHHDDIWSLNPLGPFNEDVRTTELPGMAQFPTIGPFSTLQQWHEDAMWITVPTVDSSLAPPGQRNTVVPDGYINKWDAPMPPALVIFEIDTENSHRDASLSTLWKPFLYGYGHTIFDSGTATANGTTTTLTDSTKNWPTDVAVGGFVKIERAGEYYYGQITANTATTLTFQPVTWPTNLPSLTAPGVRSGDAYWIPRFESPYYAVEIPASPYIPAGYPGWQSWGWDSAREPVDMVIDMDGPYPFWADLQMETRWKEATEPNPHEIWVYSDNHGIAGVAIDALRVQDYVTITATVDFPYTPKMGKYGPRVSDDIIASWGPPPTIEMNPWFLVDKTEVEVGETITFTNETTGGIGPYVSALWEFGDGATSTQAVQPGQTVSHTYTAPGIYTVSLTMTDQQSITRKETRLHYITVIGENGVTPPDDDDEPTLEEGLASIADELVIVYYYAGAGVWDVYWPEFGIDTIGMLEVGEIYMIYVDSNCTLQYGTKTYQLTGPDWNFVYWQGN